MSKAAKHIAPKNVELCYEITGLSILADIEDYTEGIYEGKRSTNYLIAKQNQHTYILDQLCARKGFKLLDVGCGLGTLLESARKRGVIGTGITISENEVKICKAKGLDVHLLNYKNLPKSWNGKFDGIVANGSLEHFCQPEDAVRGNQDVVYRNMFKVFFKLLNPKSPSQKVVTTAIHFRSKHVDPRKILRNPLLQIFDDEAFHFSIIQRGYGGYYPINGQLENCAKNYFSLIKEVDGTQDYLFTSENWLSKLRNALYHNAEFRKDILKRLIKKPMHTIWFTASLMGPEAWPWQFRGEDPPTRLYRHTWKRISFKNIRST
jgi:cyclopropane fatty-acyl-phospholipid synthase-like methyltransferase